jgi:hypothetical protein
MEKSREGALFHTRVQILLIITRVAVKAFSELEIFQGE